MRLRYNYRLYPTPGQQQALARTFGCARVVFNDGLSARQAAYQAGLPNVTDAELSARLTAAKATPERAWLRDVSAVVLQQALADLNAAYRNFFASLKGERKGPKIKPPRFRSRKDRRPERGHQLRPQQRRPHLGPARCRGRRLREDGQPGRAPGHRSRRQGLADRARQEDLGVIAERDRLSPVP